MEQQNSSIQPRKPPLDTKKPLNPHFILRNDSVGKSFNNQINKFMISLYITCVGYCLYDFFLFQIKETLNKQTVDYIGLLKRKINF